MNRLIIVFLAAVVVIGGVIAAVYFISGSFAVFFLSTWIPTIAAVAALLVLRQKAELKILLRSYRFDTGLLRVLPFLLIIVVIVSAALFLFIRIYGTAVPYSLRQVLINIPMMLFTGALGEELGWRGILLKQLLKKRGFITAAAITGAIWAVFHIPVWFIPELGYSGNPFPLFFISLLGGSVIYTFVYIFSNANLLAVVLLHFTQNYLLAFTINLDTEPSDFFIVYTIINLILALIIVVNWRRVEKKQTEVFAS